MSKKVCVGGQIFCLLHEDEDDADSSFEHEIHFKMFCPCGGGRGWFNKNINLANLQA